MKTRSFLPSLGMLTALLLAACVTAAGPVRSAVSASARPAVAGQLAGVQRALDQAIEAMGKATPGSKGGFVERARADLDKARADVARCLAVVATHPELDAQPVAPSPAIDAINARISAFGPGGRPNNAPNLRLSLASLQTALAYLQQTPAGEPGGYRDRAITGIDQAVSDLIAGISYADRPDAPAGGPRAVDLAGTTLYRGMLGRYGGQDFPFYFLTVPDGTNVWGAAVKQKLNGKWDMRQAPQQFDASGHFYLPGRAKLKVEAGGAVTVVIDGLGYDLSNYGKWNGIEIAMAAGLHSVSLSVGNNGGQLPGCGVKLTDLPGGTEVPIFVTADELDAFVKKMPEGSVELSDWDARQSRLGLNAAK